ncbi:MAG: glycosyltransferase family 9 protein [Candidatus Aminicenantes bacterium]|nr:glycosyltransferase family 9 protein [Candidatus Aminicenantes bacterium]
MTQNGPPRADPGPGDLKKILLIRLRRIGDIIMTTPAVALLKTRLPGASLTYLVEEPYRRLVEGNPYLDRVIVVKKNQKFRDFVKLILQVRAEGYDALLDFHGGPRASWITFFSKARLKIGYRIKHKGFLYDIRVPRGREEGDEGGFVHSVENHANLVRALGIAFDESAIPPLVHPDPTKEEAQRIRKILEEKGALRSKNVVLHIGAGNEFRDWGIENITGLVRRLARLPGLKIVMVGSASEVDQRAETDILEELAAAGASDSQNIISLVGLLNLIELKEVIARAALFVGPDSGPMHVAASTSTPIVAYFGPTLPAHFAPWKAKAIFIEKAMDCRPCKQRRCVTADFRCLRSITPDEVFAACRNFLIPSTSPEGSSD